MHDLVVRGGRVIDPAQGLDAVLDVAIDGQRITAVGPNLITGGVGVGARELLDAEGLLVIPGMVDLHTHVYFGVPPLGVEADPHCLARGVTTAVDAGSAGAHTFPGFRRYVIDVSATRIVAMLHISSLGMMRDDGSPAEAVGELEEIRWARVDRAIDVARAHADVIVGIKVRLSTPMVGPDPEQCREALRRAKEAAAAIGKPVMIHVGGTAVPLDELLGGLQRGDVVTHCYHGRTEGVLDEGGKVRRSVRQADERGVVFDVGHGAGSFNFQVAKTALAQGLLPGTISSDIHAWSIAGPVYDLATTASKFLHLGVPLVEVIRRVTMTPAHAVGLGERLGTLAPGAEADVSLLRLEEGEWPFRDTAGQVEIGRQRLVPVSVVRAGRVYPCTQAVYGSVERIPGY
jgi:dihydroorotase